MEDRVRRVSTKRGDEDAESFIKKELGWFLQGYSRCLVQGQDNYVEVWVEKDALSRIFEEVAYPYCVRCVTCGGYAVLGGRTSRRRGVNQGCRQGWKADR